jgi:hypothetical protein
MSRERAHATPELLRNPGLGRLGQFDRGLHEIVGVPALDGLEPVDDEPVTHLGPGL